MSKTRKRRGISICANSILLWVCFAILNCCLPQTTVGQSAGVVLKTVDGETFEGSIDSIELDSISLQTVGKTSEFSIEKIDSIETGNRAAVADKVPTLIELVDGSLFNGDKFSIKSRELAAKLDCGVSLNLETRQIKALRFRTYANNLELGKQYREIKTDRSREGDSIVVNRDGELTPVEGIAGDFADEKLEFSIGQRSARVALEKMDAVLFYHAAGREFALPICEILLTDNSRAMVRRLSWKDQAIAATLVCGTELTISLNSISKLNFALGRDEFLSQMEPTTNDWSALITSAAIAEKLRRLKLARPNESFKGLPLTLKFFRDNLFQASEIRQFEHGYAIQGGGKLAFSLGGRYRKLGGIVGFDPAASITGHVKFSVLVDGKAVVEQELIHRTMKNPIQLDLDIKDAKRVVFQVDFQDGRSTGDQLHLVNLKVSQ